jgi:superoxide dismutase
MPPGLEHVFWSCMHWQPAATGGWLAQAIGAKWGSYAAFREAFSKARSTTSARLDGS